MLYTFFKHKIGLICDFLLELFDFSLMTYDSNFIMHFIRNCMHLLCMNLNSFVIIFWFLNRKFHRNMRTLKDKEILIWCEVASNAFKSSSVAVLYLSTNLMQENHLKVILFTDYFDCFKVKNKMLIRVLDVPKAKIA
jgi:hypothetical protein